MTQATVRCPFCGSSDAQQVAPWGGQLMTRQMFCQSCKTHFEAVREDFAAPADFEPDGEVQQGEKQ